MTFRTLGDALSDARAQGMVVGLGEAGIAVPALRPEKAGTTKAPASSREETLPAKEVHANRCMTTAFPNGLPRPAVVIHLVVIEGGRTTEGRKLYRPTFRSSPRSKASELGWVVHSAASR